MNIAIVDYGMGNIKSLSSSIKYLGVTNLSFTNSYNDLKKADKIILPGVGSFSAAMKCIKKHDLDVIIKELCIEENKPILGICLGMQLLCKTSEEGGLNDGLDFFDSRVCNFKKNTQKIPHVGFNQIKILKKTKLFKGIQQNSDFYFNHSFNVSLCKRNTSSVCDYNDLFSSSIEKNNIIGVQFHPELSQDNGLIILKNFIYNY